MAIIAFSGGLRASENYHLYWEDIVLQKSNGVREIKGHLKKTKNNPQGGDFIITRNSFIEVLVQYAATFPSHDSFFYRCWNVKYKKWSKTRKGIKFFQNIPKEMAIFLKKKNKLNFSHHSFRRSYATSMHAAGATRQQIKMAGGWRSDKVVEHYIANSDAERRRTGNLFANQPQPSSSNQNQKQETADNNQNQKQAHNNLNQKQETAHPEEIIIEEAEEKPKKQKTHSNKSMASLIQSSGLNLSGCSNVTINFN